MGEQGSLISGSGVSDPGRVAQKVAQNNLHAVGGSFRDFETWT